MIDACAVDKKVKSAIKTSTKIVFFIVIPFNSVNSIEEKYKRCFCLSSRWTFVTGTW